MDQSLVPHGAVNLSAGERALSAVAGLMLAAAAAKPRPNHVLSLLALAGGVALAIQGASGYSPFKAARDI